MSHAKQASKRKSRACAVPLLGAAGLSLSLATGASAATEVPAADIPTQNAWVNPEITFYEEEISDVSLATFYVFDKENVGTSKPAYDLPAAAAEAVRRRRLSAAAEAATAAAEAHHGGGCHHGGCHGHGCGGCGGCGGGCVGIWWGGCGWLWRVFWRLLVLAEWRSNLVLLLT